jgi:hypothetical protein
MTPILLDQARPLLSSHATGHALTAGGSQCRLCFCELPLEVVCRSTGCLRICELLLEVVCASTLSTRFLA